MKRTALHKNTIISSVKRKYFYSEEDFKKVKRLLERYFRGEKISFERIRLRLETLPPFTTCVLQKIRVIPYGEKRSYGWVAKELGVNGASRAVGQALKRNPLTVIIPCHRVIKKSGEIGGFSKGIVVKKRLLDMEKGTVPSKNIWNVS